MRREERRAVKACLRLLPFLALVPVDALMGGLSLRRAEMTPHPRGLIGGSVEEQVQFVKMRLRQTSDATGAWIMAKKEAILTEEEIYAQKVRKFARSIDQVTALSKTAATPLTRVGKRRKMRGRGLPCVHVHAQMRDLCY